MSDQNDHLEGLRGAGAGRAYTQYYGWSLRCIWCGYTTYGRTKRDALVLIQMHYDEETSPARAVEERLIGRAEHARTYFDTVRSLTRDPDVLEAADKAEAQEAAHDAHGEG